MKPLFFIALASAAVAAVAALTAPGPYYALPAWSQKLPAAQRFIVLSDWNYEAVLDRETGLVWQRTPTTLADNQLFARDRCYRATTGGRMGWRLPSMPELMSLMDPATAPPGPFLPAGHPFQNVPIGYFFTSTTSVQDPTKAWSVSTYNTGGARFAVDLFDKGERQNCWCVRGGGIDSLN